jgi:hypothetical protein
MTMDRSTAPGEGHEPEFVSDVPDDARQNRTEGWGPVHFIGITLALLMLLAGAVWLGELVGLFAAVLPGGMSPASAALYGGLGVVGLATLLLLLFGLRRSRR